MELASGGELYDRLTTEGALEEWEVRGLLREMADAVAHIHSRGIVHGDIKPENLLLREPPPFARNQIPSADGNGWVGTKELVATSSAGREPRHNSGGLGGDGSKLRRAGGKVLLADFGSSFRLKKRSKGGVAGAEEEEYGPRAVKEYTAAYSAPEVVSEGSVDQKADVWSLGVIAYVMVSWSSETVTSWKKVLVKFVVLDIRPCLAPTCRCSKDADGGRCRRQYLRFCNV